MAEAPISFVKRRDEAPIILLDGPWDGDLLNVMHGLIKKHGWQARLCSASNSIPEKMAGAITLRRPDMPSVKELFKRGVPTIRLGTYEHEGDVDIPALLPDFHLAGRMAAEHFGERQYKNVVTVGASQETPGPRSQSLFGGFNERAEELGITCTYYSTYYQGVKSDEKDERHQRRKQDFKKLISTLPKPCGLFAPTDRMAIQICEACFEAGVEMPGEIAVLGYGNDIICEMTDVPVSSIDPDLENRCMQAIDLLERLVNGEKAPKTPIYSPPSGIVERASTDVLAASDPDVRKALNFIWDNIEQDLSVEDVAIEVGLSRNTLQRRLKQDIGRGIAEEIRRRRLECVCNLLKRSDLTVEEIASKTGFRYKSYLHRAFHKRFGMTPHAYRNECRG